MSTRIDVTPLEPGRFGVSVTEGVVTTTHKVAVPAEFLDDLALDAQPADIVRETFSYLLSVQPASAIQGDFPIDDVARDYPELYDDLRSRFGG